METTRSKIVLVDDNIATLNQGKSLLQAYYKVYTVQSARLLFEYLENDLPDLILLDVEMPEMDGFETIKKLKSNSRYLSIPVIFLTSASDEESERKGFLLGAVDYITKPFSGPLLQKRISNQILFTRVQSAISDYSDNIDAMTDEITRAHKRAKVLIETMPFSCRLLDRNYKMLDCNKAAVRLFGFKDKQDCIERFQETLPEFQPDGRRSKEKLVELCDRAFEEGIVEFEWTYQLFDGSQMPAEVTFVRLEGDDDHVLAAYTRDMRERETAMKEMQRAEMAEMASLAKTQFLAMMSHELRTPMNSITGFAELALDTPEGTVPLKIRDYLSKILDSSRWFVRIINDILDISKIESGKIELESVPFNLQDIFSRCQSVILPAAMDKGLDYRVYLEPVTGAMIIGDPLRLYQIISNLLSNAVKFTDKGTVKLSAVVKNIAKGLVAISFEVEDTGIGIEKSQLDRLFKPFMQADSSTTRNYGGTGLGLAITKTMIEMMGGELFVESQPGVGSKFKYTLEFETVEADSDTVVNVFNLPTEKPVFEGTALICDDNPLNREVICEHLSRVGIESVIAENGQESVDAVRIRKNSGEKPFDLIFMDIFMPVMDGVEAATAIKAEGVGTPIVAMTANIMVSELKKYREHGMLDCLSKPFTARELWNILLKYLIPVKSVPVGMPENSELLSRRLCVTFIRNNLNIFASITEAIAEGDLVLAHRLAHTLKGNAGQIGKERLQMAAEAVEKQLKEGKIPEAAAMDELKAQLAPVIEELKPLLAATESKRATLSAEQAGEIFDKLEPLLKSRDTACEDMLGEIRAIPGASELALQIEQYEFKQAEQTLKELRGALANPASGGDTGQKSTAPQHFAGGGYNENR